ncbi:MAG: 3-isopropylmalate dehydratase small subunit [Gammaproteobacteria bacterium]|nr:3-isopropylmalate dehydratase small subunit [Gammaproteobacteria bacterium]
MEPFTKLVAKAAPLDRANVDTDQLTPARFLRRPRDKDYPDILFHDLRFNEDGTHKPDFVLNQPAYHDSKILVADENFGCGSSRETAVWALYDYGFRAVIAPSFGDIFLSNCAKNGVLAVRLPADDVARLRAQLRAQVGEIRIDLAAQTVVGPDSNGTEYSFEIDAFQKHCMLNGLDDIGFTLELEATIEQHERKHSASLPWLQTKRT